MTDLLSLEFLVPFYAVIIAALVAYLFLAKRGKILVRIKTPIGERHIWKKPEPNGKQIIMNPTHKGKPAWIIDFDQSSITTYKTTFGTRKVIEVMFEASEAIGYDFKLGTTEQPKWDKKQSTRYIESRILEIYGKGEKVQMPTLFWLILLVGIVGVVLQFLGMRGIRL